jgi:hypothetical protein
MSSSSIVPIFIILLLVGSIAAWGYMTEWTFSGLLPKPGAKCTPADPADVDANSIDYVYDKKNFCTDIKTCEDGWKPSASKKKCENIKAGKDCTVPVSIIENASAYKHNTMGACNLVKSCNYGWLPSSAATLCEIDPLTTLKLTSNNSGATEYKQIHYLDRHLVTCPTGGINQFKFNGDVDAYKYDYKCVDNIKDFTSDTDFTMTTSKPLTMDGDQYVGPPSDIENINIDCKNKPISDFKLVRTDVTDVSVGNVAYSYKCGNATAEEAACVVATTTGTSVTDDLTAILNHEVACTGTAVLTQFELKKDAGATGKYKYHYKCCEV